MSAGKKVLSILLTALFASWAAPAVGAAGDTPSQAQPPVDCKKNPDDARCKAKKPY